jgi:hypothetical protein
MERRLTFNYHFQLDIEGDDGQLIINHNKRRKNYENWT